MWFFREHVSIRGFLMRDFALDPASAPCLGLEFVSGPKAGAKYEYDSGLSFDSDSIVLWIEDVMEAP